MNNPLRIYHTYLLMCRLFFKRFTLSISAIANDHRESHNQRQMRQVTNLYAFSEGKIKAPPVDQVILKSPGKNNNN